MIILIARPCPVVRFVRGEIEVRPIDVVATNGFGIFQSTIGIHRQRIVVGEVQSADPVRALDDRRMVAAALEGCADFVRQVVVRAVLTGPLSDDD